MKTLTLVCTCGKSLVVRGEDTPEIIRKIDASDWQDMPPDETTPSGSIIGICPDCQVPDECMGEPE